MSNEASLPPITVLGLGDMGSALAESFLRRGHKVTVWNRTRAKSEALASKGAFVADSPNQAVAASPLVVACVLDYAVLSEIFRSSTEHLAGRTVVNLTTGSPKDARAMAGWVNECGADYLDGGIMATPPMIGQPGALVLYSGSESAFRTYREAFEFLGEARFVGGDPGLASLQDMTLLSVMYGVFAGFFHAVAFAGSEGLRAAEVMKLVTPWFQETLSFLPTYAEQIDSKDYTRGVVATIGMQSVALGNILRATREQGIRSDLLEPLLAMFQQRTREGSGNEDVSAVIEILRGTTR